MSRTSRWRDPSLIARVVLALLAVAALPLLISLYQLRINRTALMDQVQRTHLVAVTSAAGRVDALLQSLRTVAVSLAENPELVRDPRSPTGQQLLRGLLVARPDIAAAGIFTEDGETVVLARRGDLREEVEPALGPPFASVPQLVGPWLRVDTSLGEGQAHLVLVTAARDLEQIVALPELGLEARLLLAHRDGTVLRGDAELTALPEELVRVASSEAIDSGAQRVEIRGREALVVAFAKVSGAPWFLLAEQPARVAELAVARIRRTTGVAVLASLALASLLSLLAWSTVVRPLQALLSAQRRLTGVAGSGEGSEIEQIRSSLEELERRVRDREELGDVFLGRYEVLGLLGTGAMGTVFRGWDPRLKRPLALKTVRLAGLAPDREKLARQLLDEAELYARFHHPNIVTVHDVSGTESGAFVAMELVDGISLAALLAIRRRLDPDQVVPLGVAIGQALTTAHGMGVVHHDVKPANVLLGRDGSIKVGDFGISRFLTSVVRGEGSVCGTPGYLAPEVLEEGVYTESSDLFAFGAVLYECLTGENPFAAETVQEMIEKTCRGDRLELGDRRTDLPDGLVRLVERLLEQDPGERPVSATAVVEQLERLASLGLYSWDPKLEDVVGKVEIGRRQGHSQLVALRGASAGGRDQG